MDITVVNVNTNDDRKWSKADVGAKFPFPIKLICKIIAKRPMASLAKTIP